MKKNYKKLNFNMIMLIITIIFSYIVFIVLYKLNKIIVTSIYILVPIMLMLIKKSQPITDGEYNEITNVYHYTLKKNLEGIDCGNGEIYLKPTSNIVLNYHVLFRKSIYFFKELPTEKNIKYNNLQNTDSKIIINIENLDRKKIMVTKKGTIAYIGEYKGPGVIEQI